MSIVESDNYELLCKLRTTGPDVDGRNIKQKHSAEFGKKLELVLQEKGNLDVDLLSAAEEGRMERPCSITSV